MKYLFKVIPIPTRWWVKILMGALWIGEAELETTLAYIYLPKDLIEIIGPANIALFVSTIFAVGIGALHLGLGLLQLLELYHTKYQKFSGDI